MLCQISLTSFSSWCWHLLPFPMKFETLLVFIFFFFIFFISSDHYFCVNPSFNWKLSRKPVPFMQCCAYSCYLLLIDCKPRFLLLLIPSTSENCVIFPVSSCRLVGCVADHLSTWDWVEVFLFLFFL